MELTKIKTSRLISLVSACAMLLSMCGCGTGTATAARRSPNAAQRSNAITVNITYANRETLERETDFAGKLEASQTVKVYPEVGGTVAKTYFNAGDTVKKGDLLFEFDSTDAQTALKQAELSYQKTIADIESAESGSANALTELEYQNAITTAQNSYEAARNRLEAEVDDDFSMSEFKKVKANLEKAEKAYDTNQTDETYAAYVAASKDYYDMLDDYGDYNDYQSAITTFENAYDNYLNAVEKYNIYKSIGSGESAASRDISRSQAELTLKTAQRTYDNHKVYAPVSGVIAAKNVSVYDMAGASTVAYTISQEGFATVSFNLSEDGANAMDIGTPVTVIYNGKNYSAEVIELAPEADSSTGLYPTKAQLSEDIGTTRSGSVLKVKAITAQEKDVLTLSLDYIYYDGNQPYVYIYDSGIARRIDITVGITTADKVSITSGLSDGDAVITTWHPNLKDGADVSNTELDAADNEQVDASGDAAAKKEG